MNIQQKNTLFQILIFIISVAGILLTLHLHLTQENPACFEGGNCADVIGSLSGPFGISNIYWGMLYYLDLALLSILPLILSGKLAKYSITIRNYLIMLGFMYSIFLVIHQVLYGFCVMCLVSALFCTSMMIILLISKFLKDHPIPNKDVLKFYIPILLTGITVAIIDYNIDRTEESFYTGSHSNLNSTKCFDILESNSVVFGNPNAAISIVKWTDYQ